MKPIHGGLSRRSQTAATIPVQVIPAASSRRSIKSRGKLSALRHSSPTMWPGAAITRNSPSPAVPPPAPLDDEKRP